LSQLDAVRRPIDAGRIGQQDARVLLFAENAADGYGDLSRRQAGHRHLVEEWLEQVMIAAIDQRHLHWQFG
jgi:hypothetical protein